MMPMLAALGFVFGFVAWRSLVLPLLLTIDRNNGPRFVSASLLASTAWIVIFGSAAHVTHDRFTEGSFILAGIAGAPAFALIGLAYWFGFSRRRKRATIK